MVWVGNFIAAIGAYKAWNNWAIAGLGLILIIFIMVDAARRLEEKQLARYGKDETFQRYIKKVPLLFPFIPLYSFKKEKVESAKEW